jgi:CheY-like chemotaxis protein
LRLYIDPWLASPIQGDAGRLRQVLMNLVGNAIKFSSGQTRTGSVSLRAQRAVATNGDDLLSLLVSDNGVGMDAATLNSLFSPFTQADASTTRRFGGTGLGLSISYRLVAMMGGEITVSSIIVDQGSTFTVKLPVGELAGSVPVPQLLVGLQCLLLGTPDWADDLAIYLTHAGCTAQCVATLSEGLKWLREAAPGRCVVVTERPQEGIENIHAAFRSVALERPTSTLTFVVITAGRRRQPRRQQGDQVHLDGDGLHRAEFLRGVALAARLDLADEAVDVPVSADAQVIAPVPVVGLMIGPLILVAEDNEVNQRVLTKQLALLGYRAELVNNGLEALASWRNGGHSLLLTDLHMPAMDGYTLAAAVRSEESQGQRLPIIALTANALRDEELRCRQVGMDAYLTKPVRLAQLKAAIDAGLQPSLTPSVAAQVRGLSAAALPPIDLDMLADLLGDDQQVMHEVFAVFRKSTTGSALAMAKAHASGEEKLMFAVAHQLKSAARAIGAARVGQICADIELATANSPHNGALDPLVEKFELELSAVHSYLDQRYLGSPIQAQVGDARSQSGLQSRHLEGDGRSGN